MAASNTMLEHVKEEAEMERVEKEFFMVLEAVDDDNCSDPDV